MDIDKNKIKDKNTSSKKPKRIMSLSSGRFATRVAPNDEQSGKPLINVSVKTGQKRKAENESPIPGKIISLLSGSMAPHVALKEKVGIKEKIHTEDERSPPKMIMSLQHGSKAPSKPLMTMKVAAKAENEKTEIPIVQKKKGSVAQAFADDSDSEEEEMPKEARMRMRNIGRETPTSAGPNSYSKGKLGFTNRNKLYEMSFKNKLDPEKPVNVNILEM